MYWADQLIQKIDKNKKHRVDDMKTPSGHAHVGSIRAIGTHGLVYEAMKHAGFDVDFTYVVNDMDPMDKMPSQLDTAVYEEHMGKPFFTIPAPDGVSESYAAQYANEYIGAFNALGFEPEIFWSSQLYASGKMNELIRTVLDNVETIRNIYKDVADQTKPKDWYPLQVICPECGKVGSSLVTGWDGKEVTYSCEKNLVKWSNGCGHTGTISPFDGNAKLMWKVDWPIHWMALDITVEGSGKDHFVDGGSHHVAMTIMKEVFKKEPPFAFLHEFLLIGGKKMSSSKGNALTAKDYSQLLPVELGRFLLVRTPVRRALNFNPEDPDTVLDLFDEYDRCARKWFSKGDETPFGRMYQASQIGEVDRTSHYLPRFRSIINLVQMPSIDLEKYYEEEKKAPLTDKDKEVLNERIRFAQLWLDKYAPEELVFKVKDSFPDEAQDLSDKQKAFLKGLVGFLESHEYTDGAKLQYDLFEFIKTQDIEAKDAFQSIYLVLFGKTHGPKISWVLLDLLQTKQAMLKERLLEGSGA